MMVNEFGIAGRARSVFLIGAMGGVACAVSISGSIRAHATKTTQLAIYVLSRARGVPAPAREFLRMARERSADLEQQGLITRTAVQRIGIEGDTRFCIEYASAKIAEKEKAELEQLAHGRDLVNLKLENCMPD